MSCVNIMQRNNKESLQESGIGKLVVFQQAFLGWTVHHLEFADIQLFSNETTQFFEKRVEKHVQSSSNSIFTYLT